MSLQEMIDMIEVQEENDMYDREAFQPRIEAELDKLIAHYWNN